MPPLVLGLPLYAFQGRVSAKASLLLSSQLFLRLDKIVLGYGQSLYGGRPLFPFIFQLLVEIIGNLF